MKNSQKKLLEQLSEMVIEGMHGDVIRVSQDEYKKLHSPEDVVLKTALDFVQQTRTLEPEIRQLRDLICQLFIVSYRESKRKESDVAEAFLRSLTDDYPGVNESALLPRWTSLAKASIAMREALSTENRLLVWQQATKLVQATNEFLYGLLPYLIIMWRVIKSKTVKTTVFSQNYGILVNQFRDLTDGESGIFYLLLRIAKPSLRNAIAHETIWMDSENGKVKFVDGLYEKSESEMDLADFMVLALSGSHLAPAYLGALTVIGILEYGSKNAITMIPEYLTKVFLYETTSHVQDNRGKKPCQKTK